MEKIYIFGHKNPDTDTVCGAIALSYLKNKLGINSEPRILGDINKETEFALKKFNTSVPKYLNDVKVQIKDVKFHRNYLINENNSIIEAFNFMNEHNITGLPLVDNEKHFKGYVSLKEIVAMIINHEDFTIDTTFDNLIYAFETKNFIKHDNHITGSVEIVLNSNNLENINQNMIVLTYNNENVIKNFIAKEVKTIIIVECEKIDKKIKDEAKRNHINIIATEKTLLNIASIINLANPTSTIKRSGEIITFNAQDYLSDFIEETSRLKHTNYPIINNNNTCLGMLRTIDAHEVIRKKVILVDHNMFSQSVEGLDEADILEIIDHHNLGDINTNQPVNFRNMAVGSVSTIIFYLYKENAVKIPSNIAGLLLSGIISDTLLLESPTTTIKDKLVAETLAKIARVNLDKYGLDLLSSGVSIENLTEKEILHKDFKTYKVDDEVFAIAQVFTTDFEQFKPKIDGIIEELNKNEVNNGYKVVALFVTNFLTNNSYLLYSESSKKILELAYGIDDLKQGYCLKGVVSRKKQMVPNIMNILEH